MILITGATGHLGNATIGSLFHKGIPANEIAALIRDENKPAHLKDKGVQIKVGRYNDYDSIKNAFRDVDKLLLISSNQMVNRLFGHKRIINPRQKSVN